MGGLNPTSKETNIWLPPKPCWAKRTWQPSNKQCEKHCILQINIVKTRCCNLTRPPWPKLSQNKSFFAKQSTIQGNNQWCNLLRRKPCWETKYDQQQTTNVKNQKTTLHPVNQTCEQTRCCNPKRPQWPTMFQNKHFFCERWARHSPMEKHSLVHVHGVPRGDFEVRITTCSKTMDSGWPQGTTLHESNCIAETMERQTPLGR